MYSKSGIPTALSVPTLATISRVVEVEDVSRSGIVLESILEMHRINPILLDGAPSVPPSLVLHNLQQRCWEELHAEGDALVERLHTGSQQSTTTGEQQQNK